MGVHKNGFSFKKYSADVYEKVLGQVIFPTYEKHSNVNRVYNNFFKSLMT